MTAPDLALVDAVRAALGAQADAGRAPAMRAYMKSEMPFLGVAKPARVAALRPVWAAHPLADREVWEATVRALYDDAAYREERYAALALLDRGKRWRDASLVPLLEHLVVTGAWWDLVDEVAGRTVSPLRRAFPTEMDPVIRLWSRSDDLWLRRTSVLSQLGARGDVDRDLLADVVLAAAPSTEFFLRKAVGWALRDLAHRDPAWVRAFVAEHEADLSPLSRREALKNL
ncbi:DNA alkylation repair protein [Longivirga aurantiaca]|uniref:DNA alkylation repair protein n=1 Tax=Longivirga aurantiaca TaxID=1837743 RepID=A0ABW1T0P9_9ACTN